MGNSGKTKKDIVTEGGKKQDTVKLVAIGAVLGVILVGAFFVLTTGGSSEAQTVTSRDGMVKLALADVGDGKAHHYRFTEGGKEIKFFVLKSSDGVVRAAFDACDVCYREKKGYRQEGDLMVCNNCGQRFPSVKINEIKGGCNPAPLTRKIDGDSLVMYTTDILEGGFYF
jgi:uncharacterized membrane protein